MQKRTTLRDVAAKAGLHHTTISRALRDDPRIRPDTRARIKALAREMGYVPDPMLAALSVYRRETNRARYEGTLAWINTWKPASSLYISFSRYWHGARERCLELGYRLDEFRLADYGMRGASLSKILRARNIQGLLLPPQQRDRAHLHLDWESFSAISFGFSLARPRLHVVTNAQYRSTILAIRKLRSHGYRRIGYVSDKAIEERTDHNFTAAYLVEQQRLPPKERPEILTLGAVSPAALQKQIAAWVKSQRVEAILTPYWRIPEWIAGMKLSAAPAVALIGISEERVGVAGIDQNEHLIGRTAVDLLVGMIHRNERGIPAVPLRTLVEGEWRDGPSAMPRFVRSG